jgi:hypothetical protein
MSRSRVTPENYERTRQGQSRVEVELILGPPGDYTRGRFYPIFENPNGGWFEHVEWVGHEAAIRLWLDDQGKVAFKELGKVAPIERGFWQWLRGLWPW